MPNDHLPAFEERRTDNLLMNVVLDRINQVDRVASASNEDTLSRLDQHIRDCASTQKWIMRSMFGLCGWVIIHSPEVLGGLAKVAGTIK